MWDTLRQNVSIPMMQGIMQGRLPELAVSVAEEAGIQFTPEELAEGSIRNAETQAAMMGKPGQGAIMQAQQQATQVGADGAVLPGTSQEAEDPNNPQVSEPDGPEAMRQRLKLSNRKPEMAGAR